MVIFQWQSVSRWWVGTITVKPRDLHGKVTMVSSYRFSRRNQSMEKSSTPHSITIFLWFSHGFLMVFLWFSYPPPVRFLGELQMALDFDPYLHRGRASIKTLVEVSPLLALRSWIKMMTTKTGWWLGHPSEKYISQWGWWKQPNIGKIKNGNQNHQPENDDNMKTYKYVDSPQVVAHIFSYRSWY